MLKEFALCMSSCIDKLYTTYIRQRCLQITALLSLSNDFSRSLLEMRLSKDVLMNFYVHQIECKMEENTILLYFFSVLVGRGGGGLNDTL